MAKHSYLSSVLETDGTKKVVILVHNDIMSALKLLQSKGFSVQSLSKGKQVNAFIPIGIKEVNEPADIT